MLVAQSLEDYRRTRFRTVEEFARDLGVSSRTYYRLLAGRSEIPTMRNVAQRLGVPPNAIAEFTPPPSPALLQQLIDATDEADIHGWIELDPDTLTPTGSLIFPERDA
jgi:transcriptional regulator with XRE-family HTH domain